MNSLKNTLAAVVLASTLPMLAHANETSDRIESLKQDVLILNQQLSSYNDQLKPYEQAEAVYNDIKINNSAFYKDGANRLFYTYSIDNNSDAKVYGFITKATIGKINGSTTKVTRSYGSIAGVNPAYFIETGNSNVDNEALYSTTLKNEPIGNLAANVEVVKVTVKVADDTYQVSNSGTTAGNLLRERIQMAESEKASKIAEIISLGGTIN